MKRIGILLALLMFCAFSMWAQDNSSTTSQRDAHNAAAQNDENAADQKKADAKEAGTASSAERDKVLAWPWFPPWLKGGSSSAHSGFLRTY